MDSSKGPDKHPPEDIKDARLANSLTAINRLPPEILGYIFFLVDVLAIRTDQLYNIVLVCMHWNQVASATPYLWTTVSVFMSMRRYTRSLKLSRTIPLVVKCELPGTAHYSSYISNVLHINTFIAQVGQHAARWKEAELVNLRSASASLQNKSFLALERLSLTPASPDTRGDAAVFASFVTPCLKELTIQGNPIPWSCSLFVGLTRLSITRVLLPPSIAELATMLRRCPNLQDVELSATRPMRVGGITFGTSDSPIHLQHLLSISLDVGLDYPSALCGLIDAPSLRHLQIDYFLLNNWQISRDALAAIVNPLLYGSVSLRLSTFGSIARVDIVSAHLLTIRLRGLTPETWFPFLINRLRDAGLVRAGSEVTAVVPSHNESAFGSYGRYSSVPLVQRVELPDISKFSRLMQYLAGVSDLQYRFRDLKEMVVLNGQAIAPTDGILQDIESSCDAKGGRVRRLLQEQGIVVELRGFQDPDGNLVRSLSHILGVDAVRLSN